MGFVRDRVLRKIPGASMAGRLADVALVGNAGLRFAHRRGMVSDEMAARFGATSSSGGSGLSASELMLVAAAALRLLGKARRSK